MLRALIDAFWHYLHEKGSSSAVRLFPFKSLQWNFIKESLSHFATLWLKRSHQNRVALVIFDSLFLLVSAFTADFWPHQFLSFFGDKAWKAFDYFFAWNAFQRMFELISVRRCGFLFQYFFYFFQIKSPLFADLNSINQKIVTKTKCLLSPEPLVLLFIIKQRFERNSSKCLSKILFVYFTNIFDKLVFV